ALVDGLLHVRFLCVGSGRQRGLPSFPTRRSSDLGYDATVIGTIGDIRYESLDAAPMRELYLPQLQAPRPPGVPEMWVVLKAKHRSEEHTSELQSLRHLVCRLLLEKKKPTTPPPTT